MLMRVPTPFEGLQRKVEFRKDDALLGRNFSPKINLRKTNGNKVRLKRRLLGCSNFLRARKEDFYPWKTVLTCTYLYLPEANYACL